MVAAIPEFSSPLVINIIGHSAGAILFAIFLGMLCRMSAAG